MTRITQDQLDNLLATVTDEEINFAQLLKANGYEANLDKLMIDPVKQNLISKKGLDFSELSLKETVFKNITNIKDISFVGANLENAAFSKDNKFQNINFSSANLKDAKLAGCAFLGEAIFTSANMLDTNIYAGNIYDLLDKKQQKEALCLRMSEATHYNAQALNELLESKLGSCQGLVNDYIRYTINGKTGYVDKINRKLSNPSEATNYFTRINSYQKNLIATVFAGLNLFSSNGKIDSKAISNEQFIESLPENVKNSGAFSFILLGSKQGGHAIAVTAVRNDKSEIIGYKIFDPNLGEIDCSDGKNAAENIKNCNQQISNLLRLYKKNNLPYSRFFVGDLEKPMIALGLVKSDTYKKEDKYLRDHTNIKVDLALALSQHNQGFGNLMMKVNRIYNLGRELTLLQVAAETDLELAAKIAIKRGDDLNKKDYREMAPLHIAAEKGQLCVMKLLVEAGADINILEKNNLTPIQIAAKFGKANTFEYLLSAGATPVIPDHDGKHLIHWAAEAGHTKMVMDLIKQGVDPNLPDKNGNTPLYWATITKQSDTSLCLLKAGADPKTSSYHQGIYAYLAKPEYFRDKAILNLLKEAIQSDDLATIGNLLKHHTQFKDKELLSATIEQNKPELAAYMISQGIKPEKTWTEWAKEKSGIDSKRDSDSIAEKVGGEVLEKYKQHSKLMDEIKEKKSKTFAKNLEDSDKPHLGR